MNETYQWITVGLFIPAIVSTFQFIQYSSQVIFKMLGRDVTMTGKDAQTGKYVGAEYLKNPKLFWRNDQFAQSASGNTIFRKIHYPVSSGSCTHTKACMAGSMRQCAIYNFGRILGHTRKYLPTLNHFTFLPHPIWTNALS